MAATALRREQLLSYRRSAQHLDERLPPGADSLPRAAHVGLQDSVPRAAVHALHARVEGVAADAWADPALVQTWGPRYAAYVVPAGDHATFTLARLPERGAMRARAFDIAARLAAWLDGGAATANDAGRALGMHPNGLRYASLTGTVLIRWDGAHRPTVWTVPTPEVDAADARRELARRYLHTVGAATSASFAGWAGIADALAQRTFLGLGDELVAVGDAGAICLAVDEAALRAKPRPGRGVRLLPSGDPYTLLWGTDRELLVPDPEQRAALWTSRVWPGAVLVDGEIVGTWRRPKANVVVDLWDDLPASTRRRIDDEAASLPA